MIQVKETANIREVFDDENARIYQRSFRCAGCGEWVEEDDTVWIPTWKDGNPYHMDCAPD